MLLLCLVILLLLQLRLFFNTVYLQSIRNFRTASTDFCSDRKQHFCDTGCQLWRMQNYWFDQISYLNVFPSITERYMRYKVTEQFSTTPSFFNNIPSLSYCFIHYSLSRLYRKCGKSIRGNDCASSVHTIPWAMGKNNRVLRAKPHSHNGKRQSAQSAQSAFAEVI